MAKPLANVAASVRQRLLDLARREQRTFEVVLVAFGLERLIHRLAVSSYRDKFVLKGGMLVTLWTADPGRFTRDVDFLGFAQADQDKLAAAFAEILSIEIADGLIFDVARIEAALIREDQIYGGVRLKTTAFLEKTRIPITIDVGFGDALGDPAYQIEYVSLLEFEPVRIRAYSPATVIAEKFQAVIALGAANSRMKDYYDLWAIPKSIAIDSAELARTIKATFERRSTEIPTDRPEGLSSLFSANPAKAAQWAAYSEATVLEGVSLTDVVNEIWRRLLPICEIARNT